LPALTRRLRHRPGGTAQVRFGRLRLRAPATRMPKCSVTIITLNEAEHIGAAIDSVTWADEVLVIDCGSVDATTEIARAKGATVMHRDWSGWIDQKNFAAER